MFTETRKIIQETKDYRSAYGELVVHKLLDQLLNESLRTKAILENDPNAKELLAIVTKHTEEHPSGKITLENHGKDTPDELTIHMYDEEKTDIFSSRISPIDSEIPTFHKVLRDSFEALKGLSVNYADEGYRISQEKISINTI